MTAGAIAKAHGVHAHVFHCCTGACDTFDNESTTFHGDATALAGVASQSGRRGMAPRTTKILCGPRCARVIMRSQGGHVSVDRGA